VVRSPRLRDHDGNADTHAGQRDSGDQLDDGAKLGPRCNQLGPSAQRERFVDGRPAGETDQDDAECGDELDVSGLPALSP
jgi:hypothetical protein